MSDLVDMGRKDEPTPLPQNDIDKFYALYKRMMHSDPPWDNDPTGDQITAVHTLLAENAVPYVD